MSRRVDALVGILLGTATFAVYMIGSGRSFGYDAAATFANFVATPSLWDAFAVRPVLPTIPLHTVASNDHVLLSLVSHVIYSITGSRSEIVYRFLPALAAGGTVGVVATALSRKFGMLAGVSAALFIATDPLFVENSRDLRGYSLAALFAVLATIILATGRSGEKPERFPPASAGVPVPLAREGAEGRLGLTRLRLVVYGVLMGLAIAAHVFAVVVLLGHVAWIATRRSMPPLVQLAPAWLAAAVMGIAANANIEFMEVIQHGFPPSLFYPTFPRDLVLFLLGAPVVLSFGLWLSAAGLGVWALRTEPRLWASLAVIAIVVAALWLGLQPAYLYPRFFIALVPGCGYLMAAAIDRWKVLAPVVLLGAVVAAVSQVAGYTEDPLALSQAAAFVERTHAAGGRVCVIHADEQVLAAYTTQFEVVSNAEQLKLCDAVVVVSWNVDLALRELAAQQFPRRTALPAYYPTVVLER
jgi:hypothetical protein